MSYSEELEKQNEELQRKLATTESKLHNVTRDYTSDDVLAAIVKHDKSFTYGLRWSAEELLKRGDGVWCDRNDRLEYSIQRKSGRLSENDLISMKIKCEDQTFFERMMRKKPIVFIEIKLEVNDPFGGDGYTRVYEQYFVELVKQRSITAMYQSVDEFQKKREEAMNWIMQEIMDRVKSRHADGSLLFDNKIQRITKAIDKIS